MADKDEVVSNVNEMEKAFRNATAHLKDSNESVQEFVDSYASAPDVVREHPEIDDAVRDALEALEDMNREAETTADIAENLREELPDNS
jgi:methyl-accepting chemotaxis protein